MLAFLDEIIKLLQDGTQQGKNSFSDTRVDALMEVGVGIFRRDYKTTTGWDTAR